MLDGSLEDYFTTDKKSGYTYTDSDCLDISLYLLAEGYSDWAKIPRIYVILRLIDKVDAIQDFIRLGFNDLCLPFDKSAKLPIRLGGSFREAFLERQSSVLTDAVAFEQGFAERKHVSLRPNTSFPFESLGPLGKGQYGVDLVKSPISGQQFARKRFLRSPVPASVQRDFINELQILKRIDHEHCVQLVASYTDCKCFGLLMLPVAQSNLTDFLSHAERHPSARATLSTFFGCLAGAVKYLHRSKIRHRDIKPDNVLVKKDQVFLTDFGLSLDWQDLSRSTTEEDSGKTFPYCAPEVADFAPQKRNSATDIWSLGCVFVEMLVVRNNMRVEDLKSAFHENTKRAFHLNTKVVNYWISRKLGEPRPLGAGQSVSQLTMSMLSVAPKDRPSAETVYHVLSTFRPRDQNSTNPYCGKCCVAEPGPLDNSTERGHPLAPPSSIRNSASSDQEKSGAVASTPHVSPAIGSSSDQAEQDSSVPKISSLSASRSSNQQNSSQDDSRQDSRNATVAKSKTPPNSASQLKATAPLIDIIAATPATQSNQLQDNRTDDLVIDTNVPQERPDASTLAPSIRASRSRSPKQGRRSALASSRDIHQVEKEELPHSSFYTQGVQDALASARRMASKLACVLSDSDPHRQAGLSAVSLHQEAIILSEFQLPSPRIIGLIGDAGVGKSSVINSLLDTIGLAREGSSGVSCTCLVTEFHFHDSDIFTIAVDYFSLEELRKQYMDLLRAYRDNLSCSAGATKDERGYLMERADLAYETFKASFRKLLEQTPDVLTTWNFDQAVDKMVEWASTILHGQKQAHETFLTVEACSLRLRELTSEFDLSNSHGLAIQCPWPFIRKVKVHMKAYILSKGLVIADLPGLRDLNTARSNITERYIRECHQVLIVARIDRAIVDPSVKDAIGIAHQANVSKIDIICTRSEDVETRDAASDYPFIRADINAMQNKINRDLEEIMSLKAEIDDFGPDLSDLTREEARELAELQHDYLKAERAKETHEFELRRHIINARNKHISSTMERQYRDHPSTLGLRIFCISNKLYWEQRKEPVRIALPYLRLSGVLELRRHCIGITSEVHLRATKEYIANKIPALYASVGLWLEAVSNDATAERKPQILEAVSTIQHELYEVTRPVSQMSEFSQVLLSELEKEVDQILRSSFDIKHWTADSRSASIRWQEWHWQTYAAWCRYHGTNQTYSMTYRCWNEEAIKGMVPHMRGVWKRVTDGLDTRLYLIKNVVDHAFSSVIEATLTTANTASEIRPMLESLAATLGHRKTSALHSIDDAFNSFNSGLDHLRTDVFSGMRTSFVGEFMEDKYRAANMEHGPGSDRRRKAIITEGFSTPTLFTSHLDRMKTSFESITDGLETAMKESIDKHIELIEIDLQILTDDNGMSGSEMDQFKEAVAAEIERVRGEMAQNCRVIESVGIGTTAES